MQPEKIGVMLVNLGTPDSSNIKDVRRYLREFLSDKRVIEANPLLWKLILNCVILPFRASKTAAVYKSVWRQETDESPLRYYTRQQAEKVAERFAEQNIESAIEIDWAMRYGNPSIKSVIENLQEKGCTRIVVLPLYPQYSATTTAAVSDEVFRCLANKRWQPTVRIAPPYEVHPLYISALKKSLETHLATLSWSPEKILMSFHGIPLEYVEKGDPYRDFCERTFRHLDAAISKDMPELELTFQSRFGPREWLQPYTAKTLESLAQSGVKKVALIAPGFAADCIETLEELQIEGHKLFEKNGGTHFTQIPCLNDSHESIDLLVQLITNATSGFNFPPIEELSDL